MKTQNLKKFIIAVAILNSAFSHSQVDPGNGSECLECPSTASDPCINQASNWFLGGNNITMPPGGFGPNVPGAAIDIGTCNDFPFVLKANNNKAVYILPNSRIGIGYLNSAPAAVLDIRDGNSPSPSSFRIYGDALGNLESTSEINMHYQTGKSFAIHEGAVGSGINRMYLKNGRLGLNHSNPLATLDIQDSGPAGILLSSQSANTSNIWTTNSISSYHFGVDANGTGQIGTNMNAPVNLIQFKWNSNNNKPQVWIGKKPTTGAHTDFGLAIDGKLVANSIYVTLQGNWADKVFEDSYKLQPLSEVENFYKEHKHLPGIPSAESIKKSGVNLEEINTLLLQKIEELTLHLVQHQKEIEALKNSKQ